MMMWIGLTGGIGTGKTTVAEIIKSLGYEVVNADQIAHGALLKTSSVYNLITQTFGESILDADKNVDRKKLGEIVFSDKFMLSKLEAIVHPFVEIEVRKNRDKLMKLGKELAFYDVPLLFEKKMEKKFDKIVIVTCKKETQIRRTIQRTGLSENEVKKRVALQYPIDTKSKFAHYIIPNNGTLEELQMKVQDFIIKLKKDLRLV